jgi:hypothetical protein
MDSHWFVVALAFVLSSSSAWAQKRSEGGKKDEVPLMDFEGDTIEGKRKAPDLFSLTENQRLSPDAILFLRKDFNEFHDKESKQRPSVAP